MYPSLSSQLNDEHRRDLLHEAVTERCAYALQQAHVRVSEQPRTQTRMRLISVDALLYQAGIGVAEQGRTALGDCETS